MNKLNLKKAENNMWDVITADGTHVARFVEKEAAKLFAIAPAMLNLLKDVALIASVNGPAINDGCTIHRTIEAVISKVKP